MEELGPTLLFLRLRRFGKSLWLLTLANYYDLLQADEFEALFGQLAIGRAPTPLRNRYLVMRWNFSMVDPSGDADQIRRALYNHLNVRIVSFAHRYAEYLNGPVDINPDDALAPLDSLLHVVRQSPHRLYLLIDEYDNFANEASSASLSPASLPW